MRGFAITEDVTCVIPQVCVYCPQQCVCFTERCCWRQFSSAVNLGFLLLGSVQLHTSSYSVWF